MPTSQDGEGRRLKLQLLIHPQSLRMLETRTKKTQIACFFPASAIHSASDSKNTEPATVGRGPIPKEGRVAFWQMLIDPQEVYSALLGQSDCHM